MNGMKKRNYINSLRNEILYGVIRAPLTSIDWKSIKESHEHEYLSLKEKTES